MQLLIAPPPPSHVNELGQGGSQDSKQAGVGKNGKSVQSFMVYTVTYILPTFNLAYLGDFAS